MKDIYHRIVESFYFRLVELRPMLVLTYLLTQKKNLKVEHWKTKSRAFLKEVRDLQGMAENNLMKNFKCTLIKWQYFFSVERRAPAPTLQFQPGKQSREPTPQRDAREGTPGSVSTQRPLMPSTLRPLMPSQNRR